MFYFFPEVNLDGTDIFLSKQVQMDEPVVGVELSHRHATMYIDSTSIAMSLQPFYKQVVSFSSGSLMGGPPQSRASLIGFIRIRKLCILMSTQVFVMLLQMQIMQTLMKLASAQFSLPLILAVHIICFSSFKTLWQSVAHITSQTSSSQ
jgi:hypothetical protein